MARNRIALWDYRKECPRCGGESHLRSEFTREPQTNILVCPQCLDEPNAFREPERYRPTSRNFVID